MKKNVIVSIVIAVALGAACFIGMKAVSDQEERLEEQAAGQEELITYNGKEYKKSELCSATLHWLELSEQERLFSSYMPPEFMEFEENWGITLSLENVTPTGATITCTQTGGEATGELQTGSWFIVECWTQKAGWKEVSYVVEGEVGWTAEAWMIAKESETKWDVNWEWLYGALPAGTYRIGKEMMDFGGPGAYDTAVYFAEFELN